MAKRTTQQFSVTLPTGMARMVKSKVASGAYASESEVIRDGLRTLQARDRALEKWLRTEVAAAYDEAIADPSRLLDAPRARERLAKLHERRAKGR